jgi:hypothetical protein
MWPPPPPGLSCSIYSSMAIRLMGQHCVPLSLFAFPIHKFWEVERWRGGGEGEGGCHFDFVDKVIVSFEIIKRCDFTCNDS